MIKTKVKSDENSRLLSIGALMVYTGTGRDTADRIGKEAGAFRKIGRRALYDRKKIDAYLDNLPDAAAGEEGEE